MVSMACEPRLFQVSLAPSVQGLIAQAIASHRWTLDMSRPVLLYGWQKTIMVVSKTFGDTVVP